MSSHASRTPGLRSARVALATAPLSEAALESGELTVSVVIPVKDDAELLERCLAALFDQTHPPDEVIVVDNGSHDRSAEVARAWGARVLVERTPGIGAASSAGYDAATGELIARLDADCIPDRAWIASVRMAFVRHPQAAAVTSTARFIDGPAVLRSPAVLLYLVPYFLSVGSALGHVPLFGSNLAMRRAAWQEVRDEVHRLDTLMHDDIDLSMHLGARHQIRFVPGMRMGISMRPLTSPNGLPLRFRRGMHSITGHWPHELPWRRVTRRMVRARRDRRSMRLAPGDRTR